MTERNNMRNTLRVTLTDGAVRNGYIHFPLTDSIFPGEHYGDASGEKKGTLITLVDELGKTYEDDVRVSGNRGRLRARFGSFFSRAGAKDGDIAEISVSEPGRYSLRILPGGALAQPTARVPQPVIPNQPQSNTEEFSKMSATNTILYGAPGTGKTYLTAARAVQLCDGSVPPTRTELMARYEILRQEQRISFVTFHQSFGYEEFVEGLRPHLNSSNQVAYSVVPGVFRKACDSARVRQLVKPGLTGKPLQQRTVCKMSLGASWSDAGVESPRFSWRLFS